MEQLILERLKDYYKDLNLKVIKGKIYINEFNTSIKFVVSDKKIESETLRDFYVEATAESFIKYINKFLGEK